MKLTRLEREGAVKLTADPLLIERFKELGYVEVGTETVPDPKPEVEAVDNAVAEQVEEAKEADTLDEKTVAEIKTLMDEKGINYPKSANKAMLIEMAHANGL